MQVFKSCLMDSFGAGGMDADSPCRVRIDEQFIVVEYEYENETCIYRGESIGPGHYRLRADGFNGDATLHRFEGSPILEGSWAEEGQQGMWRIRIHD